MNRFSEAVARSRVRGRARGLRQSLAWWRPRTARITFRLPGMQGVEGLFGLGESGAEVRDQRLQLGH
ncbi:hypothetical protein [Nitrospira sp. Kam-Ns4a]